MLMQFLMILVNQVLCALLQPQMMMVMQTLPVLAVDTYFQEVWMRSVKLDL